LNRQTAACDGVKWDFDVEVAVAHLDGVDFSAVEQTVLRSSNVRRIVYVLRGRHWSENGGEEREADGMSAHIQFATGRLKSVAARPVLKDTELNATVVSKRPSEYVEYWNGTNTPLTAR